MTKDTDPVFDMAIDFLENEADLPPKVTNKYLAACLKQNHKVSTEANERSMDNEDDIRDLKTTLNIRLGLIGGTGLTLGILAAVLAALGVV